MLQLQGADNANISQPNDPGIEEHYSHFPKISIKHALTHITNEGFLFKPRLVGWCCKKNDVLLCRRSDCWRLTSCLLCLSRDWKKCHSFPILSEVNYHVLPLGWPASGFYHRQNYPQPAAWAQNPWRKESWGKHPLVQLDIVWVLSCIGHSGVVFQPKRPVRSTILLKSVTCMSRRAIVTLR